MCRTCIFAAASQNLTRVLLLYWGSLQFRGKVKANGLPGIEEGEELDDDKGTLESTSDTAFTEPWGSGGPAEIPVEKTIKVTLVNSQFDDGLVHPLVPREIETRVFFHLEAEEVKHLHEVTQHWPPDSLKPPASFSSPTPFPTH